MIKPEDNIGIHIVGGGLAGTEAAWQCLQRKVPVFLYEMRPTKKSAAHQTGNLAELVCSNTLKSVDEYSAPGELKKEMADLNSLIIHAAYKARVPAGAALAVEREVFSKEIEKQLSNNPLFHLVRKEIKEIPSAQESLEKNQCWIIATGPLTSEDLVPSLSNLTQDKKSLAFYDAIAPIVSADSIDLSKVYEKNRYDKDGADYLNIPLTKSGYEDFIDDVLKSEKVPHHDFEQPHYFESCLPIEVMAERGRDTLRFGPMKPVGLEDPTSGKRPWAVIQLRKENNQGTMYSMVGFQTKMKWPEQKRIFQKLPGLQNADFLRFGSVHRNTYLQSPMVLDSYLRFRSHQRCFLAGQITGVEGYTESATIGLLAGIFASAFWQNKPTESLRLPSSTTIMGALLNYVTNGGKGRFEPMNANLGLLPAIAKKPGQNSKMEKKKQQCTLAYEDFSDFRQWALSLEKH